MRANYCTEDGHYWDIEDLTLFIRFKVQELRDKNKSDDEIMEFDNNEMWQKLARATITALNKKT